MSELLILGAHEKLARVHAERDDTITRRRPADRVRRRDIPADRAAADEVRRGGIDDVAEQRSLEAQAQARQAGHAVRSKR